ncbi:MAG TPA: hypothetical protein PLZ08_08960 [Bacillota bacterium]|jgi:hypothetical protein|nr:hypothetical protein [Bacillota bacterium]HOL10909.1 hypothetical protein [Bacillota bacterium]HPO98066.1 hypothetical protein [Bacillota bacterium]
MNKLIRGALTGSLIGAAVGVVMLLRNKTRMRMMSNVRVNPKSFGRKTLGTMDLVKDNAMNWTSNVKNSTRAFARRMSRRVN